jgi:hypothetical protein
LHSVDLLCEVTAAKNKKGYQILIAFSNIVGKNIIAQ